MKKEFDIDAVDEPRAGQDKTPDSDIYNPDYYTIGGIEVVDFMRAKSTPEQFYGHCYLTVMGYLSRHQFKGEPVKDLKKARWWLDKLIKEAEKKKV